MFYKGNILEFSRKTEHTHTHRHTHTSWGGRRYFKEFVHVITDSGKIEICKASKQAGYSGELLQNKIDRLKTKAGVLC